MSDASLIFSEGACDTGFADGLLAKDKRDEKEALLIQKAQQSLVRKSFSSLEELRGAVYAALVSYLAEKEYIRILPFDASPCVGATINDIDEEKVNIFISEALEQRGFPFPKGSNTKVVLTHLNLFQNDKLTNAAVFLFGKQPQRFILSSKVKCAQFYGTEITKPIPSYQVYKGDLFQLVNQAVDFILSRVDLLVGSRDSGARVKTEYELPMAAVTEAVVNAIVHRDYSSNGSVQVMLFRDRLEIWNPGTLPYGLTTAKLSEPHSSIPTNPLLAEPMYLTGYIERMCTGTGDIIRKCIEKGIRTPQFVQEEEFKTIIWRSSQNATMQPFASVGMEDLIEMLSGIDSPKSRQEF